MAFVACHGERDEARRAEAGRLAEAVRKLRDAPNHQRSPLLKLLESIDCSSGDTCELKKQCAEAYSAQEQALEGLSAVRRATSGGSAAEPVPSAAVVLLSDARENLERARRLTKTCADLEATIRRRYSL